MVKNFNEHFCRRYKEIYAYLIENFIKSQSLYIIYLESWSYKHFSIMFRYFGIDRNYSQGERWTELLRAELNVTVPFKYEKHMIRMRRMGHVFQPKWKLAGINVVRMILSHFFSVRIYSSSFIFFEEIRNKIFSTYQTIFEIIPVIVMQ